jgi:hypothetical protein
MDEEPARGFLELRRPRRFILPFSLRESHMAFRDISLDLRSISQTKFTEQMGASSMAIQSFCGREYKLRYYRPGIERRFLSRRPNDNTINIRP